MATITLDYTGSSEAPASVTLLSLTRTDTGAPVTLPSPATFTPDGTGFVFSITFTEPVPGLAYAYTFLRTWADTSTSTGAGTIVGTSGTPAGRYSDLAAWDDFAGTLNVQIYSDKDNAGSTNNAAIQRAMNFADEQIDLFFTGFYVVPLVFNTGQVSETVRTWATIIGLGKWLYFGRGSYDAHGRDPIGDRFAAIVQRTFEEMDEYRGGLQRLPVAPLTGTGLGTGVRAVAPTVNADGTRYIPRPAGSYGRYFNGQYWGW